VRVYKYTLHPIREQTIEMPLGAEILCCQLQGALTIWAKVDPFEPTVQRTFLLVGTGEEMTSDTVKYINTVQMGDLVWHIFEVELK